MNRDRPHMGDRAFTTCVEPSVSCSTAVMFLGGCSETRPQKKVLAPFAAAVPLQTGERNLNVIVPRASAAEARPMLPVPPVVMTNT